MKKKPKNNIPAEVLAAFLEGNVSAQECKEILETLPHDAELRELLRISQLVDTELGKQPNECEPIPMTAIAATCNSENLCSLECEKYILRKFNIEFDKEQLLQNAIKNGWQKETGTGTGQPVSPCQRTDLSASADGRVGYGSLRTARIFSNRPAKIIPHDRLTFLKNCTRIKSPQNK